MKYAPDEVAGHALEEERRFSDLLVVELANASGIQRMCNFDLGLTIDVHDGWGEQPFYPIPFTRSEVTSESDLTIEEVTITLPNLPLWWDIGPTPSAVSLSEAALMGLLDDAWVRLYMYDHEAGDVFYHSDWLVGDIPSITRLGIAVHLQSWDIRIDKNLPPCVIGEPCNNAVYDDVCNLDPVDWTWQGQAAQAAGRWDMWTTFADADTTWDLSLVEFTSGSNGGHTRLVRKYFGPVEGLYSRIVFTHALPFATQAGDDFDIILGCNKTLAVCQARFANEARYRGFPYVPMPEIMMG